MKNRLSQVKTPSDFEDAKKEIQSIIRDSYLRLRRREWKRIEDCHSIFTYLSAKWYIRIFKLCITDKMCFERNMDILICYMVR
jgi:hypothetical protein